MNNVEKMERSKKKKKKKKTRMDVRVLVFNVLAPQFVEGEYYDGVLPSLLKGRSHRIFSTIRRADADVVMLQEVQDLALEAQFGGEYHVFLSRHRNNYWEGSSPHGNAVLVRRSLGDARAREVLLSKDGNTALAVELLGGAVFVCVHCECDEDPRAVLREETKEAKLRREQVRAAEERERGGEGPLVVGGDFNAPRSTFGEAMEGMETAEERGRTEHDPENEEMYESAVDFVATRRCRERPRAEACFEMPGREKTFREKLEFLLERYGSDHLPVVATVFLPCNDKMIKSET